MYTCVCLSVFYRTYTVIEINAFLQLCGNVLVTLFSAVALSTRLKGAAANRDMQLFYGLFL